jgi:hypothetical protein
MSAEAEDAAQLVKRTGWFIFSCGCASALATDLDIKLATRLRTMAIDVFDRDPHALMLEWREWERMALWLEEQELRITQVRQRAAGPLGLFGIRGSMLAAELGRARMHAQRLALLVRGEELERLASEGRLL